MSNNNRRVNLAVPHHVAAQQQQARPFENQPLSVTTRKAPDGKDVTIYYTTNGGQIVCRILENESQGTFLVSLGNQHAEFIDMQSARHFADQYVQQALGGTLKPTTTPPPVIERA